MSTAILFRTTITRTIILQLLSMGRLSCPDEFQPFLTCKIKPDLRRAPKITLLLVIICKYFTLRFKWAACCREKCCPFTIIVTENLFTRVQTNFWTDKNLHGSAFRVNETRGTVQFSSEQQTVLQSATQNLHGSVLTGYTGENSPVKNFVRTRVNGVWEK